MSDRELMQQALDALEQIRDAKVQGLELLPVYHETIKALSAQLAQPEPKPVGRFAKFTDGIWKEVTDGSAGQPLYTAPPQREWQGLTDEEIKSAASLGIYEKPLIDFARAIEAKLKEKNT